MLLLYQALNIVLDACRQQNRLRAKLFQLKEQSVFMVILRAARDDDTPQLTEVRTSTLRERASGSYSESELAAIAPKNPDPDRGSGTIQNESFDVIVAQDDGILGFGVVHPSDCQIHGLYVKPEATGEGVGTALLEELEQRCRETGSESLFALATLNAAPFYLKRGYEKISERTISEEPEIPVIHVEKSFAEE
ncbi:GNAT family N-acetyltransferase [Halolamina salifodinae]|nr:GNAT family N-acetyltransferase [Halolamina salifodinae]